jgi:hypothetical protein
VAIIKAMAALLMKVLSDLKSRRFNDISPNVFNPMAGTTVSLAVHIIMAFPGLAERPSMFVGHSSLPIAAGARRQVGAGPEAGTIGIAIRACFGKPAF